MPTHPRDARWRSHMSLPVAIMQCCCISMEEGQDSKVLHRFQMSECPQKEGFLPDTQRPGDHGVASWHPTFLHHGEVFGRLKFLRTLANIQHLQSAVWVLTSFCICPTASVILRQLSSTLCKIVSVS